MTPVYETTNFQVEVFVHSAFKVQFVTSRKGGHPGFREVFDGWKEPRPRLGWWKRAWTYDGEERLSVMSAASAAIENCDERERLLIEAHALAREGQRLISALSEASRAIA